MVLSYRKPSLKGTRQWHQKRTIYLTMKQSLHIGMILALTIGQPLTLQSKTRDGKIVVERVSPKLKELSFCKKNEISELATMRYLEILKNIEKN